MGLLTRFWSRERLARAAAADVLGATWLITDGTIEATAARILTQAEGMDRGQIRAAYEDRSKTRAERAQAVAESLDVRDGVAVIPIAGVMMKEVPSAFDLFSEPATSTALVREQVAAAEARPDVRAHFVVLDTPGGSIDGLSALADAFAGATKPVHGYAGDLAASAGIWVSSQFDRFTVGPTAAIGSIGVMRKIVDTSKAFADAGEKVEVITTGGVKGALEDGLPVTDAARAEVQRRVDEIGSHFVEAVARGRGLDAADVRKLMTGEVWHGAGAVERGLADAVETEAQAFEAARSAGQAPTATNIPPPAPPAPAARAAKEKTMDTQAIFAKLAKHEQLTAEEQAHLQANLKEPAPTPIEARPDVPADVREALLSEKTTREALQAKVAALQAKVAGLERAQARDGYLAEACALSFVPGLSTEQLADQLAAADKAMTPELAAGFRASLKSTHEVLKGSKAFDVLGTSREGDTSPRARLDAKAREIAAAHPELTKAQAHARACRENPGLYEQLEAMGA